jgi:hypothetical protein
VYHSVFIANIGDEFIDLHILLLRERFLK